MTDLLERINQRIETTEASIIRLQAHLRQMQTLRDGLIRTNDAICEATMKVEKLEFQLEDAKLELIRCEIDLFHNARPTQVSFQDALEQTLLEVGFHTESIDFGDRYLPFTPNENGETKLCLEETEIRKNAALTELHQTLAGTPALRDAIWLAMKNGIDVGVQRRTGEFAFYDTLSNRRCIQNLRKKDVTKKVKLFLKRALALRIALGYEVKL